MDLKGSLCEFIKFNSQSFWSYHYVRPKKNLRLVKYINPNCLFVSFFLPFRKGTQGKPEVRSKLISVIILIHTKRPLKYNFVHHWVKCCYLGPHPHLISHSCISLYFHVIVVGYFLCTNSYVKVSKVSLQFLKIPSKWYIHIKHV